MKLRDINHPLEGSPTTEEEKRLSYLLRQSPQPQCWLSGKELDKAVAIALGYDEKEINARIIGIARYSSDWDHGGPIIEKEWIQVGAFRDPDEPGPKEAAWLAQVRAYYCCNGVEGYGPTPLIAAMRAFVCAYLWDRMDEEQVNEATQQRN